MPLDSRLLIEAAVRGQGGDSGEVRGEAVTLVVVEEVHAAAAAEVLAGEIALELDERGERLVRLEFKVGLRLQLSPLFFVLGRLLGLGRLGRCRVPGLLALPSNLRGLRLQVRVRPPLGRVGHRLLPLLLPHRLVRRLLQHGIASRRKLLGQ